MMLWLAIAAMTAAAVLAVLWPLSRHGRHRPSGSDVAVYRDQLAEVERDRAAGLISGAEADAAQVELSRRLLAAADAAPAEPPATVSALWRRRAAALAALIVVPAVALGLYLGLGSPDIPGAPLSARQNVPASQQSIESVVVQVEQHLEKNPRDGRGWEVLAPVYMRLGRFEDAARARRRALEYLGATPAREADLGEALVGAANGMVTAEAKAAFDRALATDAKNLKARFFAGLAAEQDGKREDAARIWRALLTATPEGSPYREVIAQSLARVDPKAAMPGPSAEDMAAAESLTPEQRTEFVRGMVGRLATRLKNDGSDVEGWLRLVRAYMVLGETDKARAAAADARRALGDNADKRKRVDDFVKELGLEG